MDEVECAECGNRYDSDEHPFCPRCGSMGHAAAAEAVYRPLGFSPARRRARAGGVILTVVGGLALLLFGYMAIAPPDVDDEQLALLAEVDTLATQPGGSVHLRVLEHGAPVAGASVVFQPARGAPVQVNTTETGWANVTDVAAAFGNITISVPAMPAQDDPMPSANGTQGPGDENGVSGQDPSGPDHRNVTLAYYAPAGRTVSADVELAEPPAWVALRDFGAVRVLAGFLAFFSAFVLVGGILAMRLKAWRIALAAAVVAVAPAVTMLFVVPVAGLVMAAPPAVALAFIAAGKRHFA